MHDLVIPALLNPLLVADFLMHCLDQGAGCAARGRAKLPIVPLPPPPPAPTPRPPQGGLIGILALNGVFLLVTQHGLEYPNFYRRLYGLLTPDVFMVRRGGGGGAGRVRSCLRASLVQRAG